jgi:virulence factor Mce-like protein
MRIDRRLMINLVGVALLGVLMVGWVVFSIVGGGGLSPPYTVTADFASTGGVFSNQEVTYRGVLVGKVGDLSLNEDGVDIVLEIDPDWKDRIPADVIATVQSKSAVGEQFVNLTPESSDGAASTGAMLQQGDVIPRDKTKLPVDFQALLSSLDSVLRDVPPETTRRLIENLAGGLKDQSENIATILESLGTLSDTFADVAPEQRRLIHNATIAGSAFLDTKDEFSRAIRAADDVLRGLGDEPEETRALFASNDRLARAGLVLLSQRGDDLRNGIKGLADLVDYQLRERNELVIKTLDYLPQFLHAIEDASVPWRSPDGREFYRIRIGLVWDNVKSTWPCKYDLPPGYERQAHVRDARKIITDAKCLPATATRLAMNGVIDALNSYAAEDLAPPIDLANLDLPAAPSIDMPGFMWPLVGPITSGFGEQRDGHVHSGIDIDGELGDPVVAAGAGTVLLAGPYFDYGNTVIIDHGGGLTTLYAHLSTVAVQPGDVLARGELIGLVGCTGNCTGDHLHFEVRVDGTPVNPIPYLPGAFLTPVVVPETPNSPQPGDEPVQTAAPSL